MYWVSRNNSQRSTEPEGPAIPKGFLKNSKDTTVPEGPAIPLGLLKERPRKYSAKVAPLKESSKDTHGERARYYLGILEGTSMEKAV